MIKRKSVLLLKSQSTENFADKYEDILTSNGFEVRQVKTLVFEFKNINTLKEKLVNGDAYEGIIFSSPRCVQAVLLAVENDKDIIATWCKKHNFVVGEATYAQALSKLDLECEGKESGNAVNLSKIILKSKCRKHFKIYIHIYFFLEKSAYSKSFLFPHGNLKTDTLNLELGKEGIQIEGVLTYDTIANPHISKEVSYATDNLTSIPEYVVFFSPSGFRSSIDYLKKIPVDLDNVKVSV